MRKQAWSDSRLISKLPLPVCPHMDIPLHDGLLFSDLPGYYNAGEGIGTKQNVEIEDVIIPILQGSD